MGKRERDENCDSDKKRVNDDSCGVVTRKRKRKRERDWWTEQRRRRRERETASCAALYLC